MKWDCLGNSNLFFILPRLNRPLHICLSLPPKPMSPPLPWHCLSPLQPCCGERQMHLPTNSSSSLSCICCFSTFFPTVDPCLWSNPGERFKRKLDIADIVFVIIMVCAHFYCGGIIHTGQYGHDIIGWVITREVGWKVWNEQNLPFPSIPRVGASSNWCPHHCQCQC